LFLFSVFNYFCTCALERTQAAESEASTDSRWVEPAMRRLSYCLRPLYHHCEYTVCSGKYWSDFRSVLYRSFGVSFEGVTFYSPAQQIGTVPTWSVSCWYIAVGSRCGCVAVLYCSMVRCSV